MEKLKSLIIAKRTDNFYMPRIYQSRTLKKYLCPRALIAQKPAGSKIEFLRFNGTTKNR
jgi:hypothetical protein